MNTKNDADNQADFEALYLAYRAKYELLRTALYSIANIPCDHGPQVGCPREIAQAALK